MADRDSPTSVPDLTLDAFLGGRLMLRQLGSTYRAGLDAMLLAAAVPMAAIGDASPRIVDLGAGVGAVGLAAAVRIAGLRAVLVEREEDLVRLAQTNAVDNRCKDRVVVVQADFEAAPVAELEARGLVADHFDHVLANPPFQIDGEGRSPPDPLRARAHVMPAGGVERWVRAMARLAKPGGTAVMIHRADALPNVLAAFGGRFGAITVLPVHPRAGAPAGRVIVAGRKGSRAPLRLLAGLVLHGADGHGFTPMLEAVLRHGAGIDLWAPDAPLLVQSPAIS